MPFQPRNTQVKLMYTVERSDYEQLGYPVIRIEAGTIGTVAGDVMPFVNQPGSFQTVRFGSHRIAVAAHEIQKVREVR